MSQPLKQLTRQAKRVIRHTPGVPQITQQVDSYLMERYRAQFTPLRNYGCPYPNLEEVKSQADRIFNTHIDEVAGIPIHAEAQLALLEKLSVYHDDVPLPDDAEQAAALKTRYHLNQGFFKQGSAVSLHAMLRHIKPRRVIEVGSGFSSAVMLDTADSHFVPEGHDCHFTFVDPNPQRLHSILRDSDRDRVTIIEDRVQTLPLEHFDQLQAGDVLFIDSSHVTKAGSDVNRLFFDVLPRLNAGVHIHIHDIFWPFEYPPNWVLSGHGSNELYLLRALLTNNPRYEIRFFHDYLARRHRSTLIKQMPAFSQDTGSSIWLQVV